MSKRIAIAAAFALAVWAPMGAAQAQEALKIGVIGPFSGSAASAGVGIARGIQSAVEAANAQGGVVIDGKPRKIQILLQDSESKPAVGVSAAEKLITRDHVSLILGDLVHSSVALALMDLSPQYNIPIVSVLPTATEVSKRIADDPESYKLFWKANYDTSAYSRALWAFTKDLVDKGKFQSRSKSVAFIVEDTDYGRTLAKTTSNLFESNGWKVATVETVPISHSDFYPQLTKLKRLQPDVVVTGFTSLPTGVAITKQYAEVGLESLHIGTYYEELPGFIEQTGAASERELWLPTYNPLPQDFVESVRKRWGVTQVDSEYASGYDVMNVVLKALSNAGSLDPDSLVKGFLSVDLVGLKARYVFDPKLHTAKDGPEYIPMVVGQVQNGRKVAIWPEHRATGAYLPPGAQK